MIPVKFIDPDDLPLYAMKLLPPDVMAELTSDLHHSAEGRRQLAEIYGDLLVLAQTGEMAAPPASARQRLLKGMAKEKKFVAPQELQQQVPVASIAATVPTEHPAVSVMPKARRPVAELLPFAGWLIAAGLAAFAVIEHQQNFQMEKTIGSVRAQEVQTKMSAEAANQLLDTMKDPAAIHATLTSAEVRPEPTGRVTYVASKGALVFLASNMGQLQRTKTYELWVIPADGRPAMPAGTFRPDQRGNASVMLPELAAGVPAKAFGITIEDAAGSLIPTAPIIMKGLPG